jgi:hypothetical protein
MRQNCIVMPNDRNATIAPGKKTHPSAEFPGKALESRWLLRVFASQFANTSRGWLLFASRGVYNDSSRHART